MAVDERLVKKGSREPRLELAQQLRVSGGHWESQKAALAARGFDPADGPKFIEFATRLESDGAKRVDAQQASGQKTEAERAAMNEAKGFFREVRNVARLALRKRPVAGITVESFNAGGNVDRSTPKVSDYLNKLIGPLEKAEESFKPYFGGAKPADRARALKEKLDKADAIQEVALASLPLETQQIYETMGRAVELIEELNAVAKNCFDGNAQLIGLFNKDILLRGRKAKKAGGEGPPVPPG